VRPLYAKEITVSRTGKTFTIAFENNQAMANVSVSRFTAEKLITELQQKLALGESGK
jgi:hypothetical protein